MLRKEILIICLIICCLFSLQAVAAASDGNSTDQVVLTTESNVSAYSLPNTDNQLQDGSDAGTFSDLQNDLSLGGDIVLTKNYTFNNTIDTGLVNGISVPDTVNRITGIGNIVIDGSQQARIFNIHSSHSVILTGITFINANADGNGGSINSEGTLIISDCNFINNTASGHGGAVYLGSGEGDTITNCNFEGNVAGGNGGAIDWYAGSSKGQIIGSTFTDNTAKRSGGAVHWSGHYGTIRDSNFTNNIATGEVTGEIGGIVGGGDGGAVLWVGSNGTIDNCIFTDNVAQNRGGAIFLHGNSTENCTNTTLSHSIFTNNNAGLNGGAVDWQEGAHDGVVTYCDFTNNTASSTGGAVYWSGHNGTILHSNFTNNKALGTVNGTGPDGSIILGGNGGAIVWKGAEGDIINTTFRLNNASRNGGAIFMQAGSNEDCSNITVDGGLFIENYAGVNGGALDWYEGAHDANLYNSVFINNTAERSGGAVYWFGNDGTIANSTFENNRALGNVNATDSYGRITPGGHGGAIMWTGANGKVLNSNFTLNNASRNGGAIYMQGSTEGDCSNITVDGSRFVENYAGINGGALDWYEGAQDSTLSNSYFVNNTAERSGGAVYWFGHNGTIANSTFENNRALGNVNATDSYGRITPGGHGGAVMWTGAEGYIYNSTFNDNKAKVNGGAIFLQGSTEGDCANILIDDCSFDANFAGVNGGAVDFYKGAYDGNITNSEFTNNIANRSGGAVFWFGTYGDIINSTFTNNSALGNVLYNNSYGVMTYGGHGGAIMWTGAEGYIYNSTFDENKAKVNGGAIFMQGSTEGLCANLTIDLSNFTNNFADGNGGAVDWYEGARFGKLLNLIFDNNTANKNGGAVYWHGLNGTMDNVTFKNNNATAKGHEGNPDATRGMGGAIYWQGNNGFMNRINASDNYAYEDAGVIFINGNNTKLYNSTFTDNIAGDDGGVIFWTGNVGILANSTFENSRGISANGNSKGGAICLVGSDINVTQSNFTNSYAKCTGGAIFITGNNVTVSDSRFINSSVDNTSEGGVIYIIGNSTKIYNSAFDNSSSNLGGSIYISGNDATIIGSNFKNSYAYEDGGVIYITGNLTEIYNSTFTNNTAGDDGGAINWVGNDGLIEGCVFSNNSGLSQDGHTSKGGAISINGDNNDIYNSNFTDSYTNNEGGTIFITGNNVDIVGSNFNNSKSESNNGGTIYIIGNSTKIYNSTFDNSSANLGGAIYISGNDATIVGSNFTNGYAYEDGGAIYITGFLTEIYNSTFINNTAADDGGAVNWEGNNGTLAGCVFVNNKGISADSHTSKGGTISIIGNYTKISDSNFTDSYTENNNGENVGGTVFITGHDVDLVGCNFNNSVARSSDGGTIYIIGHDVRVINSTIYNSSARKGGAIYVDGVNASVINSTINNTFAITGDSYETNNLGGAIYIKGNYANIIGSEFEDSRAYQGGALYLEGNYCNVSNSSVRDGYAYVDGGALYSTGSYSNIYYSSFTSNEARGDGGAMYWFGGKNSVNNTIIGCIFLENVAYANSNSNTKGGGAIYWSEGGYYGTIKDSQFINNSVQSSTKADGGAILWDKCHYALIDNCIFDGDYITTTNTGDVWIQGGAIYMRVDDPYTISNSKFINCYSEKEAGALYIQSNTNGREIFIVNTTFENNVAQAIGQNSNGGGAVQVKQCDFAVFQNVTFRNNTANQGGAVTVLETRTNIQFINCTFDNNKATNGNGGSIWANKLFYIYNTTIANSTASDNGGGLYTIADMTYNNITFINNTATYGGGLYWNKANIKIQNMKFINNTALERGGAIYITTTSTVQNVTMTGNKAFAGSAIWANKDLTLIDVYVMENQANSSSLDISFDEDTGKIVVLFKGKDKYLNAIYLNGGCILYCTNVTYWDETGEINSGETRIRVPTTTAQDTPEGGQNLTVRVYGGDGKLVEQNILTDNDGKVYLNLSDIISDTNYHEMYVESELNDDTYYTIIKATTRSASQVNASANKTTYHSNSTLNVNVTQGATGNVSVYIGDTFIANITLDNSKGSINMSTLVEGVYLPVGNHTLSFVYNGNVKYDKSNTTAILEITKITPVMLLNVTGIGYNLLVNVTVMDGEYNITDATGNVTIQVEDRTATIYLGNGQGMTIIYGLPIGNYTVNATYHGDNNYYNITNSTEANVTEKTQTVLVLDVDSEKLYYINETVPIKVTILPKGEGNITLYINGIPHELTLQTVDNSTFVEFNATELKDGINYVFATYEGTEIYAPSWAQDRFNVTKYNSTIGIETANITFKDTEIINITLPEDAEGIIKVLINDTPYLVELVGGSAQVNVSDLAVGTYNVTVIFNGDKKYYNSTNSTLFNVTKIKPAIEIDVDNVTYGNETVITVILPDGVTGNVTIKVNDTIFVYEEQEIVDGKVTLPGTILPAGNYTVEATYNGDGNYSVCTAQTNFTVYRQAPVLTVTVEDINYGESANITVTVPDGVTGTIIIKVNGTESEPLTITEGKVNLTVAGLAVGNYPVEVIYSGNDNYSDDTVTTDFEVFQIGTELDVDVHDITVWDTEYINITIKDAAGEIITNATGNVTINIDGVNHTAEIKDGIARFNTSDLTVGHKVIWVFYDGDRNLTANRTMVKFNVGQRTPTINITAQNITVGEDGNITVKVPANATGYVVIEIIGGDSYFKTVTNGQAAVYPQNLKVGNYTVRATYYGISTDNYTVNTAEANFTVKPIEDYNITVIANNITYGENATVIVTLPSDATGNVTIYIDGVNRGTVNITNGIATLTDIAGLEAGQHEVNVTYNGNERYASKDKNGTIFHVLPTDDWTLDIDVEAHKYGEDTIITVTLPENAKENVTLEIDGVNYTVKLTDGVGELRLNNLSAGLHEVNAYYPGDENYTNKSSSDKFIIDQATPTIIINATPAKVGDNATINITVSGNATGNVTIYVDGQMFERTIVNHSVTLNVTDLASGNHNVVVFYKGDQNYTSNINSTSLRIFKDSSDLIVVADPESVVVGKNTTITVTSVNVTSGNVIIEVNGINYTVALNNGVAKLNVTLPAGDYTAKAYFLGDDKYNASTNTSNVFHVINKTVAWVNITADKIIEIDNNLTFTVTTNSNATLVVKVNGVEVTPVGGVYSFNGTVAGNYTITAEVAENDYYTAATNSSGFVVYKHASEIASVVVTPSVVVGKDSTITVTMANNETGSVMIEVNGYNYTVAIKDHVAQLNVTLPVGDYTAKVYYPGDDKYNATSAVSDVFHVVNKTVAWVNITADKVIEIDHNLTFTVTTNSNATLVVKVNGVEVVKGADGKYRFNGTVAGNYTITAEVAENDYYTAATNSTVFTVYKHASEIESVVVTPVTTVDGHNTTITVTMANAETGSVLIEVNGLNYTVPIKEGVATLTVTLPVGDYTAKVYYPGDDKYNATNAVSDVFHVVNKTVAWVNITADKIIEIDNNLTFTVTTNSNATLVVKVNGVEVVKGDDDKYRFNGTVAGNYTITAEVAENDYFTAASNSTMFTVIKHNSTVSITVGEVYEIESDFNIIITNNTAVVVTINGREYAVVDGKVNVTTAELSAGHYIVTATIAENDKYYANSTTKEFDIIKHNATIDSVVVPSVDVVVGKNATITVTMGNVTTGSVIIEVGGHNYTVPIVDKVAVLNVTLPVGDYTAKAYFLGDDKYNPVNATSAEFSVVDKTVAWVNITAPTSVEIDNNLTFTVTTNSNATLVVKVNGVVVTPVGGVYSFNGTVAGNYTITAEVAENDYYTAATNSTVFTVYKHASEIESVVVTPVTTVDGHNTTITVTMANAETGSVLIEVNGLNYTVPIKEGVATLTVTLPVGDYTAKVYYPGDDKYNATNAVSDVFHVVNKTVAWVNITADKIIEIDNNLTFTVTTNSNATLVVKVNGVEVVKDADGKYRFNGTVAGNYTITAEVAENDYYTAAENSTVFTVYKHASEIESVVVTPVTTVDGHNTTITVTMANAETGSVLIEVNGLNYTVPIKEGVATLTVTLPVDDYTAKVYYPGDDKYNATNAVSDVFHVINKTVAWINITADSIIEIDNNLTFTVTTNSNATLVVKVNGVEVVKGADGKYRFNGTVAGNYTITAEVAENDYYTAASNSTMFTVIKHNSTVSITVGEVYEIESGFTITITNNTAAVVIINGKEYPVVDGKVNVNTAELPAGHYIVTATIAENDKYYANSTTKEFDIIKHNATIASIVVPSVNVGVGKNATITVTMGNVTSGSVIIEVGGHNYTVPIVDKVAVLNVTLPVGDYTAKAYYLGDDKYNPVNATSDEFSVKDKEIPTIIINAPEIIEVDNNITFTVTNSTPVNVTVNGVTVEIKDGKYTYNATVAGTATIIVRSAETDDYYEGFNSTTVTVIKHNSTVSIDEIPLHYVGDNFTINVTNNTAVVVTINGKEYPVADGKVVVDTTKLPAGEYTVTATVYENDKYYGNSSTISFNITKRASSVNITVGLQYYVGDIFNITIENNTAVNVTINGKSYLIDTNGNIIIDTTKLPAGEYIVSASVAENDKYFANATSKTFNIVKKASDMTVVAAPESVVVGKNTTITVTMANNETGSVIIEVNGVNYTVAIKDHVAKLNVTLPAGDYTAKAYYLGDDKYNASNATSNTFYVVDKTVAWVNITADTSVEIDNNITFTVTTNSNATLVVKVNGVEITPVGGVYSFNGTVAGNYTITAEVAENDYYTAAENSTVFTVYKHASEIESVVVTPVTAVDGHNTTITVTMANAETGNVLIEVNGLNYTVPIKEGVATLTVTLPVGDYTAKVYYPGDDKYNATSAVSDAFHVINKTIATVNITADSIIEIDSNLTFTVVTNSNATLVVKVNGVEVVKGADGKYRFNGTVAGNYTITAEVAENDYYTAATNSTVFTVIKHNSTVAIDVGKVYEIESDFTITITNNTAVVVTINGKEYPVVDGKVNVNTVELPAGHYIVTATIAENDKYYANTTTKEFDIIKHNATIDSVVVPSVDVVVGKEATITVTMGNVTSGSVIIEVGGHNYTVPIVDKVAELNVTLPVGDYTAKAYYLGDDKYNPVNATSDEFSVVNKTTATVIITADKIIEIDNNLTFTVTTNSNSTLVVKVNGVVVTPVGGVYSFNGTVAGNYTITAEVAENDYYTQASNSTMFTVIKHNSTVKVDDISTHYVGDEFEITLTNNTAAVVTINGKEYSVVDGKVVVDTTKLPAGEYTVTATVYENDKYYGNSSTISFNITKSASSVNVTVDPINVNETAIIDITGPSDFNGTAVVNVNGMNYSVALTNGVGQLKVDGLANGTYDINVTYLENDKYLQSVNDTVKLLVNKVADAEITASADNITVGDPAVIKVTVPDDATGNVTVTIGNITRTVPIAGGENEIIVPGVPVGDYEVKVTYNGDDKYLPANTTTPLSVKPAETDPADIKVIDQGNGTVVVVVPKDATGNVNITINGTNYTSPVVNGTATFDLTNETPGTYDITATYSGDENYTAAAANGTVTIPKYATPISIEVNASAVGNITKVIVSVPENVTENVTVEIDGKTYSVKPVDGKAVFEIEGLTVGNKTVVASYAGDDWYLANSTTAQFKVDKVASSVNVTGDVIKVDETATIVIAGPSDFNGTAVVTIGGKDYSVNVTNGAGQLKVDGLANATYDVKVTLLENDKYLSSSNDTAKVIVNKVSDAEISASADNITVGDPAVIKVTVPEDATGNVTVTIGNITRTVPITGGENEIIVPGVPVGDYEVKVTYNGDDKYLPANTTTPLSVKPAETSPDDIKVIDQGNGTVVVVVPANATGNVTVTIDGNNYTSPIVNGTATFDLTNETPGTHDITATYSGDENHKGQSTDGKVTIPKHATPMSIEVTGGKVGETIEVTVNVPENVTGNVTVEIDGKTYSKKPVDGKAVFEITGLLSGNKTVTAIYDGDDSYLANATTADFTVDKNPAPISVEVDNSTNGQATVTVTLPEDATGYVVVNVAGTDYGINLTAGEKSVTIPIKGTGDYTANVIYLGDEKYLGNSTSKDFHISSNKTSPNIGAEVDNVPVGEDVKVKVIVPEGGDGNVTVTVDNITVTAPVTGGENIISIPGVSEGTHDVNISYSGNDQYNPQDITKSVKVFKSVIAENITRGWNSPYDYKAEFLDKNGHVLPYTDVQFTVNGKTYTVKTDSQGIAFLDTSKLAVGKYDVTIINPVTGEERTATTTIVKRLIENKDITMDFVDGTYYTVRAIGDDGKPVGEGEFVDIYVHTIHYSCRTDANGYARLKLNLNPGKYTITAEYKNTKVSNKLVVKQTLKLVKKTVKVKKGKKLVLKAKLKWSNGKPIKGKIIKFTFKGKTYKAKTNSKGIAKVTIKKKVTKKLKKGKKYAYSAKYLTNIVKGKVKVK